MDFNTKLEVALARVSQTGIWQNNYAPPIYRCLWLAGFQVPPPHFAKFGFNALFSGTWFGASWAIVMSLMFWSSQGLPSAQTVVYATALGALFGLMMASYYAIGAWQYGLPHWNAIAESATR